MKTYIVRRVLPAVLLLVCISSLCFVFINMIPSDLTEAAPRVCQIPIISEEAIEQVREELGLNDSYLVRYGRWVMDCLHLDFGVSYINPPGTVLGEIKRCLPVTAVPAFISLVSIILLSLPIGLFRVVYKNSRSDWVVRGIVFMTTAMPTYWIGPLLIWFISIKLDLLPTSGNGGWKHLILPSFIVSLTYISTYIRLIHNNMLENMKEDYVLYANVRGLRRRSILARHILKNSLYACIVAIGMSTPQLMAGTIVVENIFAQPGLDKLCTNPISNRDYPVIQTYALLIGTLSVVLSLLFDIIQCIADPGFRREVS